MTRIAFLFVFLFLATTVSHAKPCTTFENVIAITHEIKRKKRLKILEQTKFDDSVPTTHMFYYSGDPFGVVVNFSKGCVEGTLFIPIAVVQMMVSKDSWLRFVGTDA